MNTNARKYALLAALVFVMFPTIGFSSTSETIASGTMSYSEIFGGPATLTVRRLLVAPGEVLGWHAHPGLGAYTVVKRGTLTIEDGCGGTNVYEAGQAFLEPPNRVHRGKNLGSVEVETIQTFLVPAGTPISSSTGQACGAPAKAEECSSSGWATFTYPRTFENQGDCIQFVMTGK